MQRKLQVAMSISAQHTFDDKKRSSNTSAKTVSPAKFDFSKLKVKKSTTTFGNGRSNYQMPSIFNRGSSSNQYAHKVMALSKTGLPLFIESEAGEETKKTKKVKPPKATALSI